MKTLILFAVLFSFAVVAGDDVQKAVEVRNLTVQKAKEVFDKAEETANTKLVADLKLLLKRPNADKVAIATEIVKIASGDSDALAILNAEGKLANLGKDLAEMGENTNKAVFKLWNDKSKLDYVGMGLIDVLSGVQVGNDKHVNATNGKYGTVRAILNIPENGYYKVQSANYGGSISVAFAGKKVDWSKLQVIPLSKGKYPIMVELNGPGWWRITFVSKDEPSMQLLGSPYLETDMTALKEYNNSKSNK